MSDGTGMSEAERSGGTRLGALAGMLGLVAAITVGAIALGSSTPAAASGLQRFTSCEEIEAWTADVQPPEVAIEEREVLDAGEGSGGADRAAAAPTSAQATGGDDAATSETSAASATGFAADTEDSGTGGTNTVVEGVDEIDVIDRVGDDRLLVSRNGVLALVDLTGRRIVADLRGIPYDARISVADGLVWIAGSSNDGLGTEVRRVRIEGDALTDDGTWTTPGYLLDARRTGDRLHVVAVDQPPVGVIPFEGGPVPCDQVWRPVDPAATPAATLVATLPATGDLAPTAATEVTGSAGNLLVTDGAVYVATESWSDAGEVTTGLHRFDIATLAPTGSGEVPGTVAGPFALNEHEGTLRVATSAAGVGFVGRPVPIEGDVIIDDAVVGPTPDEAEGGAAVAVAEEEPAPPEPTETTAPGVPTTIPADTTTTTTTAPATTTSVPETSTTVPETTTTVPETTTTAPPAEDALAEVFVLDTEGDLDVLGSTGRFGHDFETIHGVRFVGDVAYVVTFRQTDPFWVIDLSEPAAPAVAGQLQIPGFSGYLHPIGEERVVGFGPDGNGAIAARLFDVSDPASPAILDEIRLGDDSPVAYDHHAFVGLGDARFAVPVTDYPTYVEEACPAPIEPSPPVPLPQPLPVDPGIGDGSGNSGGSTGSAGVDDVAVGEFVPVCEVRAVGGETGAAVLEVAGGRLMLAERATVESAEVFAERVVLAPDGTWLLLSWDRLVATDGGPEIVLPTL